MHERLETVLNAYIQENNGQIDNIEALLAYLRNNGCSVIDSIKVLRWTHQLSLNAAKERVHLSATWADRLAFHERFHDRLEEVARELNNDVQNEHP